MRDDKSQPKTAADVSQSQYRDIGAGVSVSNDAPKDIRAAADNSAPKPPFERVAQLAPVVHITPDGPLAHPVTLRFKLNRKIDDPRDVVIATNPTGKAGDWQLVMPSKVDGEYAYFTATHLSWWDPLWRSFTDLVNAATTELKKQWDGLTDGAFAHAEQPKCDNEQEARDKGYSIKWSGAEVLHWCLGLKDGKPTARVANKRSYPVFVAHQGIAVPEKPQRKFDAVDALSRFTTGERTVLMATDQLRLEYDLSKGESKTISTEYDGFAESLYQAEFGVTMLANILTRYGAVEGGAATKALSKLLQMKDCTASFNTEGDVGRVISGCFDPAKIIEIFGWKGVLVAMVMIAAPVAKFFTNTFETLGDLLQGKDREKVTVSYNPPPPLPKVLFAGRWTIHGFNEPIVIDDSRTTTFSSNAGPCPMPDNEYMMCDMHVTISFKVTGKDVMTGTYTKVWYTTDDDRPAPDNIYREPGITAGKTFTVKRNDDLPGDLHTLKTYNGTGSRPGNPYLCDGYALQRNNTPKYQLCGA